MSYMVPLRFIRVSNQRTDNRQVDTCICATRIVAIMSTNLHQARKVISDERKNGTLINCCGLTKAKSAIFLDNGSVISSPLTVRRLMTMIERSGSEIGARMDKRMRIYDVYNPDPDEDEEDKNEVSVNYGDDKEDENDSFAEFDEDSDESADDFDE